MIVALAETRKGSLGISIPRTSAHPAEARSRSKERNALLLFISTFGVLLVFLAPLEHLSALDIRLIPRPGTNHVGHFFTSQQSLLELFAESNGSKNVSGLSLFVGFLPGFQHAS
jgi:hypothetical protein